MGGGGGRLTSDLFSPWRGAGGVSSAAAFPGSRHHLISPAVICASDHRGGHFYSCHRVGDKQDVACGATAVCISACLNARVCVLRGYLRKEDINLRYHFMLGQSAPSPRHSLSFFFRSYSSIAGLSAIINSSWWRTEFKPGPYRIILYMSGGGAKRKTHQ